MSAYDNRLFYVVSGRGNIRVGDKIYPMKQGMLIFWRAGISYDLCSDEGYSLELIGCNFDYTQKNAHLSAPVPPSRDQIFQPENMLDTSWFTDLDMFNQTVCLENMQHLEHSLLELYDEYNRQRILSTNRLSALFLLIMTDIARTLLMSSGNHRRSAMRAEEILNYICQHYAEDLSNQKLGQIFNYHPNYINRLMVAQTGISLHKYLIRYRIQCALNLIQTTDMPIADIAEQVGFHDYNYFLKYFKKITGYNTRSFRP